MSDAGTHHQPVSNPIPFNDSDVSELLEQAVVYASINGKADAAGYLIDYNGPTICLGLTIALFGHKKAQCLIRRIKP